MLFSVAQHGLSRIGIHLTFSLFPSHSSLLAAAGEEDTHELLAQGVGYHHDLVLDPSKEIVIDYLL